MKLAKGLTLPVEAVCWKMAILGRTGSGKTNTAIVMAEQMIAGGYPVVILDPQGDWWGLREKYPIAILGGDHADIPLKPEAGETVAEFVIDARQPVLLDLFGMGEAEMVRFATDFAKVLWKKNREALHVFLDEADLFAPQSQAKGPKAQCLGAWQNVVRRGRSRGIGCTMITQRSAVLNKDLLTQADPVFVHRMTASNDLAAIDTYLDFYGYDKPARREITKQVSGLDVGEAMVLSPGELRIEPTAFKIDKRKSFDSSATPAAGESKSEPKQLRAVDLAKLEARMVATIEQAKENDPKELRRRIAELQKQVAAKPQAKGQTVTSRVEIERAVNTALVAERGAWKANYTELQKLANSFRNKLIKINEQSFIGTTQVPQLPDIPTHTVEAGKLTSSSKVSFASKTKEKRQLSETKPAAEGLTATQQRILNTVATLDARGITANRDCVARWQAIHPNGGRYGSDLAALRANGYLEGFVLTDAGRAVAVAQSTGPEGVIEALADGTKERLFRTIVESKEPFTRDTLAAELGIHPNGGRYGSDLAWLRTMQVITERGPISATPGALN